MPALVRSRGPALRHVFGDIGPDVEAFGILRLHPIDVHQRLEQLLFRKLPDVAGIGRHLALQRVDVVGDEGAEELVLHRIELPAQAGAAALSPEHAANLRMRGQVFLDAFADGVAAAIVGARGGAGVHVFAAAGRGFAARPLFGRVRIELDVAGLAGKQLLVDVGAARLQPRLRLRRVRKLVFDPLRRLIDAGLGDVATALAGAGARLRLLLRLARHLVDELQVRLDLPLGERARDRVEHHRIGFVPGDDQHRFARLQDAHALALQPRLVAHERPRRIHQIVDRLRRLEVRRPARLGILLAGGAGARGGAGAAGGVLVPAAARSGDDDHHQEDDHEEPQGVRDTGHRRTSSLRARPAALACALV